MKKLAIISLLLLSSVAQAGTLTGAIVGGAVGYAAGKSNSTTTSSPDLVLDMEPGILVLNSIRFLPEGDRWLRNFVRDNGYKHYHLRKIIVRSVGSSESYYYIIKAWN